MFGTKKNKKGGQAVASLVGAVSGASGGNGANLAPLGGSRAPLSLQSSTPSITSQEDVNGNSVQMTAQQIMEALPDIEVERRFAEMLVSRSNH